MTQLILAAGIIALASPSNAAWECRAICHYYLPNSSHTHPSLPDQAHETLLETTGDTEESAYEQLRSQCEGLGMEPGLVHPTGQQSMCWDNSCVKN